MAGYEQCGQGCCGSSQPSGENKAESNNLTDHWKPVFSFILLASGLALEYLFQASWFVDPLRFFWYAVAYVPVGFPVLEQAVKSIRRGDVFTEFFLMGIATIGAFLIGEYPEGVGVMLFYSVGEAFQHNAVQRAQKNIEAVLDVRPDTSHVMREGKVTTVHPESVRIGETIQVKPGERVPLDGYLLSGRTSFDTSALTGESKPGYYGPKDKVLAGMINLHQVIEIEVSSSWENSSISRILELVKNASSRKAKTEKFIRTFARYYTPAVVASAVLLVTVPALVASNYIFSEWLYRGLVFLVISCPCALMISIPLGYFGGIGAASRNGILIKGSNFLDALKAVNMVVLDKTGTLTKGTFTVQDMHFYGGNEEKLLPMLSAIESKSNHPIAKAIASHIGTNGTHASIENQSEIPGFGIKATVDGQAVLIGSKKLMQRENISTNGSSLGENGSTVHMSVDGRYEGYITISDEMKEDSVNAVGRLRKLGVSQIVMLSGDKESEAQRIGEMLKLDQVYGELLPEQKAHKLEELKRNHPGVVAYAGDGINDSPVLALSDVGIAMGAMGSDAAIETADVVIQTDHPSKIATAIGIGRATRNIVWQNIWLALGVKVLFLSLGALGIATLWEAVFADVGVTLLAILNSVRIQKMTFL
ncbi:MAG: heavy metal translocating P-type ATPase [Balneolales bacterium]